LLNARKADFLRGRKAPGLPPRPGAQLLNEVIQWLGEDTQPGEGAPAPEESAEWAEWQP
jgi:hypothetical protein